MLPLSAVVACIGLFYLGFPSCHYNFDGTVFAYWLGQAINTGDAGKLWHARHLLHLPLVRLFYLAFSAAGFTPGYILFLQLFDIACALFSLVLFGFLCLRITGDRTLSIVSPLLPGFSFAFWYYAVEPEAYQLFSLSVLMGIYLAIRWSEEKRKGWVSASIALGFLGALSTGFHVVGSLCLIPLCACSLLYLKDTSGGLRKRILSGLVPAFVTGAIALVLILAMYYRGYTENPLARGQGIIPWITAEYNPRTGGGYQSNYWMISPRSPLASLSGFKNTIASPAPYRFRESSWLVPVRLVAFAGMAAGMLVYLLQIPRFFRRRPRPHVLLWLFILPLSVFFTFWQPLSFEHKMVLVCPLSLAVLSGAASARDRLGKAGGIAVMVCVILTAGAMFVHNFTGSILPFSFPENNPDLQKAYFVREHTGEGSVVYLSGTGGFWKGKIYLLYFGGREPRVVQFILKRDRRPFPAPLLAELTRDRDRRVYLLSELLEPGDALASLEKRHGVDAGLIAGFFRGLGVEKQACMNPDFCIYELKGKALPRQ